MPIPVLNFPELSGNAGYADIFRKSMNAPQDFLAKQIANQIAQVQAKYAEPRSQEELNKARLMNQIYGVQAKYAEPMTQEDLRKSQLANQYYGLDKESNIGLKNAQAEHYKALENPGAANSSNDFMKLPKPSQKAYIDQIVSMGYSYPEAIHHAYEGTDFGDLAQQKGFSRDLSDVPRPQSELTGATKTQLARSNMAKAGLDSADNVINEGIAHYSGQPTIKDVPLGFYRDAITGDNKEKQSDFIASTVLAQDQAFLRARQAGAPLSQGLLKHTLETSLTDVKARYSFVSPEVFKDAGRKIKKAFDDINAAENKAAYARQTPKSQPKLFNEEMDQDLSHLSNEELRRIAG